MTEGQAKAEQWARHLLAEGRAPGFVADLTGLPLRRVLIINHLGDL